MDYKNEFLNLVKDNYKSFNWKKCTNCEAFDCNFNNGLALVIQSKDQYIELRVYLGNECKRYSEYDYPEIRAIFDCIYNTFEKNISNKFFIEAIKKLQL